MEHDQQPAIGDRVQRRGQSHMRGKVWDIHQDGLIIVQWDHPDENAYCHAGDLEIIPRRGASGRGR